MNEQEYNALAGAAFLLWIVFRLICNFRKGKRDDKLSTKSVRTSESSVIGLVAIAATVCLMF